MPTLKNTIRDLLLAADQKGGGSVETKLKHGLYLHVRKIDNEYLFTIYRLEVYPSAQEWNTCIAHWPYPIGAINWHNKWKTPLEKFCLQARIPEESDGHHTN